MTAHVSCMVMLTIAPELGSLTALTTLALDDNDLVGAIPTQLSTLTKLTALLLSENELSGSIPSHLGELLDLQLLHVNDNDIAAMPEQICDLRSKENLEELWADCEETQCEYPACCTKCF